MNPNTHPQKRRPSFWRSFFDGEAPEPDANPPCAKVFNPETVFWVMNNLPVEEAVQHFLVCGTVGSGKTKTIQLFLQSIAPRFLPGHPVPEQLIVFDAKGDLIPRLEKLGIRSGQKNVWILNPFDKRAATWDLGEAIQSPAMARYLASLFVAEEPNSTAPYFPNTAREIVFWVALSLSRRRRERGWTLRDLLNALESKEHIAAVTAEIPRGRRVIAQHLGDKRHFPGVLSTLATKLGKFEEVAALWATSKRRRRFSIKKFLKRSGVLILGHDPVLRESLWPINAIILQALTNEILRSAETRVPRHWFVLDEFRAMGEVRCIRELLNLGRSKGASVLLGIQSVEGLIEIYKEHATQDMLSLCTTKTFLRAGGPFTAEWAERHFSKIRHNVQTVSETRAKESSTTVQYQVVDESLLLPSMFLDLPIPKRGGPFKAISDIPCLRTTLITERQFDDVLELCREPTDQEKKEQISFMRDNPDEQIVKIWDEKEEADFCGTLPPPDKPAGDKTAAPEKEPMVSKEKQRNRRHRKKGTRGTQGP